MANVGAMLRRRATLAVLVALVPLGGCSPSSDTAELPRGGELTALAADKLRTLHSAHVKFAVNGTLADLPIRELEADATSTGVGQGYAAGSVEFDTLAGGRNATFTLAGNKVSITDETARHTQLPAPPGSTPAALMDPDNGLRRVLLGASGLETEREEQLNSAQTYRVGGTLAANLVPDFVPNVQSTVDVKFWLDQHTGELVRIWMQLPPEQANRGAVMLELELSKPNAALAPTS